MQESKKPSRRGRPAAQGARTSRPRQAEVARAAGVSQATVSLILADKKDGAAFSDETRRKVLDAARELGYVPDPAARRLAAARNNLLGVFSFTATFPTEMQHSYYPFLVGVEQEAAARGYDLVLFTGSSSGGAGAAGPDALGRVRLADGCLFLGRHIPTQELRRLVADGFPAVHLGRRDELEGLAWVGADYVSAGREVVGKLADLGHRRFVLIREDDDAPASTDREQGFLEGLTAAGLDHDAGTVHRSADPRRDITPERLRGWLAEGVTAFVAEETDTGAAWRALRAACRTTGLQVPRDASLALLGSPPADLSHEAVPTGFDIPRTQLGAAAVRLLASLVAGEDAEEPLVTCTFRPGETAGPPPSVRQQPQAQGDM
ncbi:LacI family DNA-binding transcriptional regulator [Streptomyces beijiangensis]|uniref:LacI family DNA-binding transcriptional regulator n=1 Tax=Streptomyces beijiangensis TaxID=163361 RepID=A0A939JGC1_9ACTN|nr:LacI family DNA-binding transcriptional regulator [Streptomyces beijiangensis]MBO0515041.1 LacI family DNA-binding transcriptional regulator [Streptomyces beijiangensis]